MSEEKRWIVISYGVPQREIAGKTAMTDEELQQAADDGKTVELEEARFLQTMHLPTPQGIAQNIQFVPIGLNRGAIKLRTKVVFFYDPKQEENGFKEFLHQLEVCEKNEVEHRAKDAGIETPGSANMDGLKTGPSGKLVS
jgi:hypothetical protein